MQVKFYVYCKLNFYSLAIQAEILYYILEVQIKECFDAVYRNGFGVE